MTENKILKGLDEVKADAEYITLKRINDAKAEQAHKESKIRGVQVEAPEPVSDDPQPGQGETYEPKQEKKGK